jgi:hypothetical protein
MFLALLLASTSTSALSQSAPKQPTLSETLTWLSGASEDESGDGKNHHTFEIVGSSSSCSVVITEYRAQAGEGFWIKEAFSLSDIDPKDIYLEDLADGEAGVTFHTVNYSKKIMHTSNSISKPIPTSYYLYCTNSDFAPRFAKALKHASELCGGKPSSF